MSRGKEQKLQSLTSKICSKRDSYRKAIITALLAIELLADN